MSTLHTALLMTLLLSGFHSASADAAEIPEAEISALADGVALSALEDDALEMLEDADIDAVLTARVKAAESLAAKAERKQLRPDEVLDRIGLRVVVDSIADCYTVLDAIHSRYVPVLGNQDDYIAHPKANGYQSLHTAVRTPLGVAEFQVRTHDMHAHAEHGGASHFAYKAQQKRA